MRVTARLAICAAFLTAAPLAAQETPPADQLEARVWLSSGEEPVLQQGDRVRVYYRTSGDAYVAIFRIDTDGRVSLLFPQHPGADPFVRGGQDYRLLFPYAPDWTVDEYPGVGYLFMVASPEPLDLSAFSYERSAGWDLTAVSDVVYEDPYLAMDEFIASMIPDWEVVPYALDFLTYNVGEAHSYPRFLCYDCHRFQSYASWNPYTYPCTSYRVVIWDDPYFYPSYRYAGTRVVFARPLRDRPRFAFTARAVGASWTPLVRVREAPSATYKEPATSRNAAPIGPPRRASGSAVGVEGAPRAISPRTDAPTMRGGGAAPDARSGSSDLRRGSPLAPQERPSARAAPSGRIVVPGGARAAPSGRVAPPQEAPPRVAPPQVEPDPQEQRPTLRRRPSSPVTRPPTSSRPSGDPPSAARRPPGSGSSPAVGSSRPSGSRPPSVGGSRPSGGSSQPRVVPRRSPPSGASSRGAPARSSPAAGSGSSSRGSTSRAQPSRPPPSGSGSPSVSRGSSGSSSGSARGAPSRSRPPAARSSAGSRPRRPGG